MLEELNQTLNQFHSTALLELPFKLSIEPKEVEG